MQPAPDPPRSLWFVYNPGSHSVSPEVLDRVRETIFRNGGTLAGETQFPDDDMPGIADLEAAGVDTLIALGGDGTITCAATRLAEWQGRLLVLPGGTMNLIPRMLHKELEPDLVIARAFAHPEVVALPYVAIEDHRSFARVIAGPAAAFVHLREDLRAGRLRRLWRTWRTSWQILWSRTVAIADQPGHYRAIFIRAGEDDRVHIDATPKTGRFKTLRMARSWLVDLVGDAGGNEELVLETAELRSSRPIRMVLDGEERFFNSPATLRAETSARQFFATREFADDA